METNKKRYWVTGYDYDDDSNRQTFQAGVYASCKTAAMDRVRRRRYKQKRIQVQIVSAELIGESND